MRLRDYPNLLLTVNEGILRDVRLVKRSGHPDHLILIVEHNGHDFSVALGPKPDDPSHGSRTSLGPKPDDPSFIRKLYDKLKADFLGRPMPEVWDGEIDF
jgi:hypothetical protein